MDDQTPQSPADTVEEAVEGGTPAQDAPVPDPTGARDDPGTDAAIRSATDAAKDDIASAMEDAEGGSPDEAEQPEPEPEDQDS